jgi:hypothetical protein
LYSRVLALLDPVVDDCWLSSTKGVTNSLGDGGAANDTGPGDAERWRCRLRRHNMTRITIMNVGMSMHGRTMATVFLVLIFVDEPALLSPAIVVLLEGEAGGDEREAGDDEKGEVSGDESDADAETGWETLAPVIEDDVGVELLAVFVAERLSEVLGAFVPVSELVLEGVAVPMLLEALGSVTLKSDPEVAMGVLPLR